MAPNGEVLVRFHSTDTFSKLHKQWSPPPAISTEGLHGSFSEVRSVGVSEEAMKLRPPTTPEQQAVEDAKCECCGMSEECTAEYVCSVREKFAGRWICGLCAEAVKEETGKNGGRRPADALEAHVSECVRFNRIERTQPVLFQTEAMKKILRKSYRHVSMGITRSGIARSSSCV